MSNIAQTANDLFAFALQNHRRGDYKEAIDFYGKAIAHKEDFAVAYLNRGSAKAELGKIAKAEGRDDDAEKCWHAAIEDYRRAKEKNPKYALAYYAIGVVKVHLKLIEDAKECFRKARELDSSLFKQGDGKPS